MTKTPLLALILSGCFYTSDVCEVKPLPTYPGIHITVMANDVIMSVEDYTKLTSWRAGVVQWAQDPYQCE